MARTKCKAGQTQSRPSQVLSRKRRKTKQNKKTGRARQGSPSPADHHAAPAPPSRLAAPRRAVHHRFPSIVHSCPYHSAACCYVVPPPPPHDLQTYIFVPTSLAAAATYMAGSPDDGGDGREVTKALRGEEGGRVACETQPRKKDKKRKTRSANKAPPPPPAPSQGDLILTPPSSHAFDHIPLSSTASL